MRGNKILLGLIFLWIVYVELKDIISNMNNYIPPFIDHDIQLLIDYKKKYKFSMTKEEEININREITRRLKRNKNLYSGSPIKYFVLIMLAILLLGLLFPNFFND